MAGRTRVLSALNGPMPAEIMIVGEAPGRRGAERSAAPFRGDISGQRLDLLLDAAGWKRCEIFITNAVLCNPQDEDGRNRRPAGVEISNCGRLLAEQIELVNPRLVVALGAIALSALNALHPHALRVSMAGHAPVPWDRRWLAATYHPSMRAAIHRKFELQLDDFRSLGDWLRLNAESDASR